MLLKLSKIFITHKILPTISLQYNIIHKFQSLSEKQSQIIYFSNSENKSEESNQNEPKNPSESTENKNERLTENKEEEKDNKKKENKEKKDDSSDDDDDDNDRGLLVPVIDILKKVFGKKTSPEV